MALRMAMVGGGPGSFIGPVHRMAAELDGRIRLVAGVFSRDPAKSAQAAAAWGVSPDRVYPDHHTMFAAERGRADGVQLVSVVTPNHLHFDVSAAALKAGLHVISDKPATLNLAEAQALAKVVAASGKQYGLTYTYTGYPMVREAREIVARGDLGAVRKVVVEYSQGWLSTPLERDSANKQASWRADPSQSGVGGCIGDIGVHAFNIAEFITGRRVERLCADVATVVPGRDLDDDCNVLLRFEGGARGVLIASQISAGARNGLTISVYGEKGGLTWSHEDPNILTLDWLDGPSHVLHAGSGYLGPAARAVTRLPTGHPEGFIEAFATIYRDFADAIEGRAGGLVPDIAEGVRGMTFVERAVAASRDDAGWVSLQGEG
ncbi:gfo/Idh/MocA family oxidoreductase [Caulobacter vibrioides]|uniref:Gfo/Idh/MocA family protein n=1 Tax=Caulobacter vibrioides TaxID=155892 RepID=UPI000BB4E377|nr:Gfo/Idh/MocA family oxidoreductase [Caulobacter vibrioides]ATC24639.1 gfo/Idh/MocA family oxidoreductase [Caulobacter vibrioides]AZH12777.1 gfo/Idh/MocA family oxidoreductase [Caulobacter vibrioides]PLR09414.1 gfo/Idh/MocA family oxidoreductase [Caulobacter vibrioides]